jgi:glycerol uptake facilitator-like aquaporin
MGKHTIDPRVSTWFLQHLPATSPANFLHAVATFGGHSGGHLNPAISLAAALSGHMAWASALMYILAQVRDLAAVLASLADASMLCW